MQLNTSAYHPPCIADAHCVLFRKLTIACEDSRDKRPHLNCFDTCFLGGTGRIVRAGRWMAFFALRGSLTDPAGEQDVMRPQCLLARRLPEYCVDAGVFGSYTREDRCSSFRVLFFPQFFPWRGAFWTRIPTAIESCPGSACWQCCCALLMFLRRRRYHLTMMSSPFSLAMAATPVGVMESWLGRTVSDFRCEVMQRT